MTKQQQIKKEYKRISALFVRLPENQRKLADSLIQNAAFMRVTLDDLQAAINENGCGEEYHNGENQTGRKASAELQGYNALIKNYNNVMDKLEKWLPKEDAADKLEQFLND